MPAIEPRKTPRQHRAQATVDALLEAAARILEQESWEALSTNAVAQTAGASIGSVYQYFPNKEAMVAELIRRERAALLIALEAALEKARGRPWMEGIAALVTLAVDHQLSRPRLAAALDYAERILPMAVETAKIHQSIMMAVAGLLATCHMPEPEQAAQDVMALVGGLVDAAARRGETDREPLRRRALRAAWGYLNTSEGSVRLALK